MLYLEKVALESRLTREEYSLWFMDNFERSHNPELNAFSISSPDVLRPYHVKRIDPEFEHLRKSEFLLENFSRLHYSVQSMIELFLWEERELDLIETFARLSLAAIEVECGFDFNNVTGCGVMDVHLMKHVQSNFPTQDMIEFNSLLRDFILLYSREQNPSLLEMVVLLLVLVYDLSFVVSTLKKWTEAGSPGSGNDFARVVENWEKDFDMLPIDWVTNIIRAGSTE